MKSPDQPIEQAHIGHDRSRQQPEIEAPAIGEEEADHGEAEIEADRRRRDDVLGRRRLARQGIERAG